MSCDKCGQSVPATNDATLFDLIVKKMRAHGVDYDESQVDAWCNAAILAVAPRHLLPVHDGEKVVCPGSPSRAQYLEGQARDTRGFTYDPSREALFRAAYARLQTSEEEGDETAA